MTTRPITLRLAEDEPSPAPSERRAALVGVVEDLVALLEAQFPSSPEFPGEALRTRLNLSRDRLRAADHPEDVSEAGLRLVGDASQAYARLSGHVSARDAEYTGVIRLLRELVDGLRGDAMAFRNDLLASSERVADLTQIEDIRTLRRALNREVDQLRQCVQRGEHQEASRIAQVAGDLKKVDDAMAQPEDSRENAVGLFARAALLRDLASSPVAAAALVVCRIDEPEAIVDGHGASVLERVIIALAQLLKGSFGNDSKVYRSSAHSVTMFLPRTQARQVAQQVRKVQARVAPEYEYERHGVTRRVVFTFSAAIAYSPGKTPEDAGDALTRAERQASQMRGLSQLEAESSGLGRLVSWLSSAG
jgi:GGDEF domain-containing protein